MGTFNQIVFGTIALVFCSAVHILLLTLTVNGLSRLSCKMNKPPKPSHWGILIAFAFSMIVFAHTIQIWVWAVSFVALAAFSDISDALYFTLVTYTTLGYGDITLGQGHRIYAAMAAVTGLLNFGLSTAFLVSFASRILPSENQ